jgi:hypothetical protein
VRFPCNSIGSVPSSPSSLRVATSLRCSTNDGSSDATSSGTHADRISSTARAVHCTTRAAGVRVDHEAGDVVGLAVDEAHPGARPEQSPPPGDRRPQTPGEELLG